VLSQEPYGVTIGQDQIRQIQDKNSLGRLGVNQLGQFIHTVGDKLAADRKDRGSAARAMDSEHRPVGSDANPRPLEGRLNVRSLAKIVR
jgi:hypothetical protein